MRIATDKASGAKRACKSILKRRVEGAGDAVDVRKELDVMLHLAGEGAREHKQLQLCVLVHIVMEYCEGGDLVKRIIDKGHYTERDAAAAIRTVLEVIAYSHDMGCMHRDIKPDNCLLADTSDSAPLKIADWGYADFFRQGQKLKGDVGTSFYMAPNCPTHYLAPQPHPLFTKSSPAWPSHS
ncbi:hypothetical protein MNEG_1339 [Monoraphidium neglectum]|uniref:Protein kinase domain-containing protein n=1 Tax=Monoraphidium neglectum TaxID=145388 RepID=A0A0D2MVS3_9CHLO|nr:hypothetical protein MNEG_1339 [Monoraphidium neglectum]KIZ06605.1 hypothetical protein MNEG_1339 [Monoraphidium neglectum]|eukprot:XP_013905624.1 hypothetical protein MNEG_1339 [Monoraphidium neglectum]